jgi:hypothetical protein
MEQDNSHGDTGGSTPSPNTTSCLVDQFPEVGKSLIYQCRRRGNPQGDRQDAANLPRRSGRVMSSEYATEQVPLAEIQEGDTVQDPKSGQWFTVTRTAETEGYRVYYGDERQGEQVDSRCIIDSPFTRGLITRQVRE